MGIKPADESVDLRRGVDHIGVTVASIIHNGHGRVLLMKRGPMARDERGKWDLCGGAVEFGEKIEDAIVREVNEELCVQPKNIQFLSVYDAHRKHQGNHTHWVALLHAVEIDPRNVKIGEPHKISKIGWFNISTLPTPLHSQFHKALEAAKNANIIR